MLGLRWAGAVLGIATCLFAPRVDAQTQSQSWDNIVSAAKKEGRVTVYSANPGAPQHVAIAKLFEARYGIHVDILEGVPNALQERIRTEVAMNSVIADMTHFGANVQYLMHHQGLLTPHGDAPNFSKTTLKPTVDEDIPIFVNAYGILINTDLVAESDQPKSWLDLLDPKWKGKMLFYDMSRSGSGSSVFGVLQDTFGTAFHEKLARQEPQFFGSTSREGQRRIARGEYALSMPFVTADMSAMEGLPVKGIVPKEGLPYTLFSVAAVKGAPHPNAARLLMNFFLEPEAQLVYARSGFPIALRGLENEVPEKWRWSVNAKLLGRQNLEGQEERLRLAARIYLGK